MSMGAAVPSPVAVEDVNLLQGRQDIMVEALVIPGLQPMAVVCLRKCECRIELACQSGAGLIVTP
jgi:hypothetical protein